MVIPEHEDPIFAAIGLHWPRDVLELLAQRHSVARELALPDASTWGALCARITEAALHGEPPPPEVHEAQKMLRSLRH